MLRPQNSSFKRKAEETSWGAQDQGNFKPRKVCNHWKTGSCNKGPRCTFAHAASQLHPEAAQEEFDIATELEERAQLLGEEPAAEQQSNEKGGGKDKGAGKGGKGDTRFPVFFRPMRICQQILAGSCPKGDACSFAHSLRELHLNASEEEKAAALVLEETGELEAGGKDLAEDVNLLEGVAEEVPNEIDAAVADVVAAEQEEEAAANQEEEEEGNAGAAQGKGKWQEGKGQWQEGKGQWQGGKGQGKKPFFFQPRKICGFFVQNKCKKGDTCTYAHSTDQLHPEAKQLFEEQGLEAVTAHVPNQGNWGAAGGADNSWGQPNKAWEQGEEEGDAQDEMPAKDAPKEDYGIVGSSLDGPREFPAGREPTKVCMAWLRHSNHCEASDFCPYAHGLDELKAGIKVQSLRCTDGPVAFVSGQASGDAAGSMKGHGKGEPMAIAPWTGKGVGKSFGKGGKAMGKAAGNFDYNAAYENDGNENGKGNFKGWGKGGCKGKSGKSEKGRFANAPFQPNRICTHWLKDPNGCQHGNDCNFAHGVAELQESARATCGIDRFHHMQKPTKMCVFFEQNSCTKGVACTFAHDPSELANAQKNEWA